MFLNFRNSLLWGKKNLIWLPTPFCALNLVWSLLTNLHTKCFSSFTQQDKFLSTMPTVNCLYSSLLLSFKETDLPWIGRNSPWVPDMQISRQWQSWGKEKFVIPNTPPFVMGIFLLPTVTTALEHFFSRHWSSDHTQFVLGRLSLQPQEIEMCHLNEKYYFIKSYSSCPIVSCLSRQVCFIES